MLLLNVMLSNLIVYSFWGRAVGFDIGVALQGTGGKNGALVLGVVVFGVDIYYYHNLIVLKHYVTGNR